MTERQFGYKNQNFSLYRKYGKKSLRVKAPGLDISFKELQILVLGGEGKPYDVVARICGISTSTVNSMHERVLRRHPKEKIRNIRFKVFDFGLNYLVYPIGLFAIRDNLREGDIYNKKTL